MKKKQVSIMFTDTSVRDYIVTADSIEECEKIFVNQVRNKNIDIGNG